MRLALSRGLRIGGLGWVARQLSVTGLFPSFFLDVAADASRFVGRRLRYGAGVSRFCRLVPLVGHFSSKRARTLRKFRLRRRRRWLRVGDHLLKCCSVEMIAADVDKPSTVRGCDIRKRQLRSSQLPRLFSRSDPSQARRNLRSLDGVSPFAIARMASCGCFEVPVGRQPNHVGMLFHHRLPQSPEPRRPGPPRETRCPSGV